MKSAQALHGSMRLAFSLAAVALMAAGEPACAQAIFTTAPAGLYGVAVAPAAPVSPPPPAPAIAAAPRDLLRHLPNTIQGFRISGEIGALEWPIYFTQAQTHARLRFQLGYVTAVSVMPEASVLKLIINDVLVASAPIEAGASTQRIVFDVPEGVVKDGFNAIRLSAEQRHRVDCSIAATYELWTQIDPTQTGFLSAADAGVTELGDLAALAPDEQGALPIRAIVPDPTNVGSIERIDRAAQLVALIGRVEQPVVDIGPLAGGEYGLNIAIGAINDLRRKIAGLETIADTDGPRVLVLPPTATRRTTLVITGATERDVDDAFAQFTVARDLRGAPQGVRAARAFPGYRIEGGQKVRLSELGVASESFNGRLFRVGFNIVMPPDFYSADYARGAIDLAGGYAPGLTSDAQVVVSINSRIAVNLKLPKSAGDTYEHNAIPLPLGVLRPGLNRIEIEAQLPMPRDAACDPLEAMTAAKRFLFLDATTLELPRIARIARVPDLSIMATGGFPYAVGGKNRPRLAIPSLDPASIGAAATLATHLAIASGEPIDFEVSQALPRLGAGATLVVAPVRALDDDLLRAMNLQQGAAITAWRTKAPVAAPEDASLTRLETIARNRLVLQRNFPPACHMRRPPLGWARNPAGIDLTATGQIAIPLALDPLEEWNRQINGASWSRSVRAALSGAKLWIDHRVEALGSGLEARFTSEPTEVDIAQGASLVMAQAAFGGARDDIWTLVTAPTAARMAEAVACMVDPRVWRQIAGRVSALDETNAEIHSIEARDAHFLVTERLTIENVRLITAGWFSQNAIAYVAAALVLALLIGGSTLVMVRNIGRRN